MAMLTVRDAIRLDSESFGDDGAPLLLLVSGAGAPAAFWPDAFCRDLAGAGLRVVRYCHRDTGLSTHCDEPYAIDELLLDLRALLDALGGRPAHLAGHSMGGYLAQMAACRFPEAVASIASISAGSAVTPEACAALGMSAAPEATWRVLMRNEPVGDFERDLPGWLASWRFLNGGRPFDREMAVAYTRSLYVGDPRNSQVAANHVHAMGTVPDSLAEDLRDLRLPLLVVHGTEDPLVPFDNGRATARLAPGGRLVPLEGAGHMFFDRGTWEEIRDRLAAHALGSGGGAGRSDLRRGP